MYNSKRLTDVSVSPPVIPQISSLSPRIPFDPNMKRINELNSRIFGLILLLSASAINIFAQRPSIPGVKGKQVPDTSGGVWFYITVAIALVSIGVVFYFWRKSKQSIEQTQDNNGNNSNYYSNDNYENDVDAEKELEWLRKAKNSSSKTPTISFGLKKADAPKKQKASANRTAAPDEKDVDAKAFQDRMKMLQYAQLPINSFNELVTTRHFELLLDSDAKVLMVAIEQANEEFEKDERVREAAIKTMSAFRTSNSVEALSQVALYDLSASIRSKATTVLTDFDHETVFETILLACADPTREVRAAAARGLFRLSFDRSGAWKRIIDTGDEFRMSQAVRAAIEAGIVTKSFDRLVHEDMKIAYEAFTLVALLIKSGENNEIFKALRDHKDERVKYALLHVLKAIKDERSLAGLNDLLENGNCPAEVMNRIKDVIISLEHVAAHSHA